MKRKPNRGLGGPLPEAATILAVNSRAIEKQGGLSVEHSRRLRTDPWNSRYIEIVTCVSRILLVDLSENNKFQGTQVSLPFLRTNFCKNCLVENAYLLVRQFTQQNNYQISLSEKADNWVPWNLFSERSTTSILNTCDPFNEFQTSRIGL